MQMGTRWAVGASMPDGLPEVVQYAVQSVEEDLRTAGTDAGAMRWTLTWLESKPVIELDDGTVIRYNPTEDSATITGPSLPVDDEDDWI
ncbi:MAG TPA: hypothetical protein VEX88_15960 [Glaciibacter sp.]|nr:hypothetical protein [Glaciibacter sp.]